MHVFDSTVSMSGMTEKRTTLLTYVRNALQAVTFQY